MGEVPSDPAAPVAPVAPAAPVAPVAPVSPLGPFSVTVIDEEEGLVTDTLVDDELIVVVVPSLTDTLTELPDVVFTETLI